MTVFISLLLNTFLCVRLFLILTWPEHEQDLSKQDLSIFVFFCGQVHKVVTSVVVTSGVQNGVTA